MEAISIPTPPGVPDSPSPTGQPYLRRWWPLASTRLDDGTFAIFVKQSFWDYEDLPGWLWHVAEDGALLHAVEVPDVTPYQVNLAATPEGFVLLGGKGSIPQPLARRYDATLQVLGDDDVLAALGTTPARFNAGASRDGASVLVGNYWPAWPGSQAKVAILERTHFP
jgi:hypothetical protein